MEKYRNKKQEPDSFYEVITDSSFKRTPAFLDMIKLFICMTRMPQRAKKPRIHLTYLRQAYKTVGRMNLRIV